MSSIKSIFFFLGFFALLLLSNCSAEDRRRVPAVPGTVVDARLQLRTQYDSDGNKVRDNYQQSSLALTAEDRKRNMFFLGFSKVFNTSLERIGTKMSFHCYGKTMIDQGVTLLPEAMSDDADVADVSLKDVYEQMDLNLAQNLSEFSLEAFNELLRERHLEQGSSELFKEKSIKEVTLEDKKQLLQTRNPELNFEERTHFGGYRVNDFFLGEYALYKKMASTAFYIKEDALKEGVIHALRCYFPEYAEGPIWRATVAFSVLELERDHISVRYKILEDTKDWK